MTDLKFSVRGLAQRLSQRRLSTHARAGLGRAARMFVQMVLLGSAACREPGQEMERQDPPSDAAMPAVVDMARPADLRAADLAGNMAKDMVAVMWPPPMPPPTSCNMRSAGVTAIQAVLRIDEYVGLQTGRNGVHEIAEATVIHTSWIYDGTLVDTSNIHLAMNVASMTDPAGLPMELPLRPGQTIEVEGEYIPAAKAMATNKAGPAAVVHFTHMPCGYTVIAGKTYR